MTTMDESTKITPEAFKRMPPLIDTADLIALGFSQKYIYAVRMEVRSDRDRVPFGRVGWIRNPSTPPQSDLPLHQDASPNGTNGTNHKGKWRRSDVARILGPEWQ